MCAPPKVLLAVNFLVGAQSKHLQEIVVVIDVPYVVTRQERFHITQLSQEGLITQCRPGFSRDTISVRRQDRADEIVMAQAHYLR